MDFLEVVFSGFCCVVEGEFSGVFLFVLGFFGSVFTPSGT